MSGLARKIHSDILHIPGVNFAGMKGVKCGVSCFCQSAGASAGPHTSSHMYTADANCYSYTVLRVVIFYAVVLKTFLYRSNFGDY